MRARPLRPPLLVLALLLGACAAAPAPAAPAAPADPPPRAQRSANLSHITGTSRRIQMFLKNRNLQLLPDGTVNGTTDDTSEYTVLQRLTTGIGLLRIQGIATCLYLCMDSCGFLYAHKDFSDDCVFDEHMEENNYNTYSRTSGGKRTFVALDNRGRARRLQLPAGRPLGNLSGYALTLTRRLDAGGPKACARRHKDKHKKKKLPPPFHRNCARRLHRQKKRPHKKAHEPDKKKTRQPKGRRKQENVTTTTDQWEESTASTTTEVEFFRSPAAREAVGGRA